MIDYGFNIKVTVKEISGDCEIHKVGDEILYDGLTFEGKICSSALASLFPHLYALAWGAEFPWDEDKDITTWACPDRGKVIFELRRDRSNPWYQKER